MDTNTLTLSDQYSNYLNDYTRRVRSLHDHVDIEYPDRGQYIGQIHSSLRDGQGIYTYPSGDIYFGGWRDDCFHGQGVYMFASGEIYDGLLNMNGKEGIGTYYYGSLDSYYSGNWYDDLK